MKYIVTALLMCVFAASSFGQEHRKDSKILKKKEHRVEAQECEQCNKVCAPAKEVAILKKQVAELKKQVEGMRARMQKGRSGGRTPPGGGRDERRERRLDRDWADALQRDGIIPGKVDKVDPETIKAIIRERMDPEALKRFEDMRKNWADRSKIG